MGQDRKLFWKRNCLRDLCKRSWEKREGNLCVCVCVCVSVCVFQFKNFHILRQRKPEQLFSLSLSLSLSHTLSLFSTIYVSFFLFCVQCIGMSAACKQIEKLSEKQKTSGKSNKAVHTKQINEIFFNRWRLKQFRTKICLQSRAKYTN